MTPENSDVLVSVLCPVFNQKNYVRECLDSVLAQHTTFKYEILVNDDHSTDGTAEIVKEYAEKHPSLIRAFLQKENQFSKGVDIVRDVLLPEAQGKYIAICEGDDYWIDAEKLQKQAGIMEQADNVGLVYTYFYKYNEQRHERFDFHFHELEGNVYDACLASKVSIWYVTVMMRRALMLRAPRLDTRKYFTGDVFWYYWITSHSEARLLREFTGVYRVLPSSVSHFEDRRKKIDFFYLSSNTRLYFLEHFPTKKKPAYGCMVRKKSLVNLFKYALLHGDYALCRATRIPFLPIMSLKKTGYAVLRLLCTNEHRFMRMSELYNRYLDKREHGENRI